MVVKFERRKKIPICALLATVVTLLGITAAIPSEQPSDPFGAKTVAELRDPPVKSWNAVREQIQLDDLIVSSCTYDNADDCGAAKELMSVVDDARQYQGRAMIAHINRSMNLMIKPTDGSWSSPLDILKSGSGDCKDYAIAKYAALLRAGIPTDQLRLIIVRRSGRKEYHMVVSLFEGGQWLLLDNLTMMLVKDSDRRNYVPQFVLDRTGVRRYLLAQEQLRLEDRRNLRKATGPSTATKDRQLHGVSASQQRRASYLIWYLWDLNVRCRRKAAFLMRSA
jgi:predicted transglutaminase-like cysteine proteinase